MTHCQNILPFQLLLIISFMFRTFRHKVLILLVCVELLWWLKERQRENKVKLVLNIFLCGALKKLYTSILGQVLSSPVQLPK